MVQESILFNEDVTRVFGLSIKISEFLSIKINIFYHQSYLFIWLQNCSLFKKLCQFFY